MWQKVNVDSHDEDPRCNVDVVKSENDPMTKRGQASEEAWFEGVGEDENRSESFQDGNETENKIQKEKFDPIFVTKNIYTDGETDIVHQECQVKSQILPIDIACERSPMRSVKAAQKVTQKIAINKYIPTKEDDKRQVRGAKTVVVQIMSKR